MPKADLRQEMGDYQHQDRKCIEILVYCCNIHLMAKVLEDCEGFEWDEGNSLKNWHLHRVSDGECEEVFFNVPLIVVLDKLRTGRERRFFALGKTDANRHLFIAFTLGTKRIRIISARDMTQSEERRYEEKTKRDPNL